jgi:transcription elongation factor GreA
MADEEFQLTPAGHKKLEQELYRLVNEEMQEVSERLADVGDGILLGEEANFSDAIEEKERLEERISRLRYILARATIIEEDPDPDAASPGDRVRVRDEETGEELTFDLLSGHEVAFGRRRGVTIDSPVGRALLNKRIGDTIEVKVPDGKVSYTILGFEDIPDDDE